MARGDSKKVAEYDFRSGRGDYNNATDTFSWLLVTDTYASIDANTVLNAASFTAVTPAGEYAGKTAVTGRTWTRTAAVSTLNFDDISFAANPANPVTARCLVILNDTSANDDAVKIVDLTTDGSTAVDLTQGFTYTVNAGGSFTVTANA